MISSSLSSLRERFLAPGLTIGPYGGNGPLALHLSGDRGRGTVLLQGGQLWSWQPAGQPDLLWQSSVAAPVPSVCPYGGIPICWPYMGSGPQAGDPFHGAVRCHDWDLLAAEDDGQGGWRIRLATDHRAAGWRQPFALVLTLRLGDGIEASLEVINRSDEDLVSAGALHSYLAIGDRRQLTLHHLRGLDYRSTLEGPVQVDDGSPLPPEDEWVRNYLLPNTGHTVLIDDPVLDRRLHLGLPTSTSLVLWNPGPRRAAAIAGIGSESWPGFVCLEAANILHDRRLLAPGHGHVLATTICSTPCNRS